jgi:predicted CXXCH cytochrome family protein
MTAANCKQCHKAHMPKAVTYASGIESKFCAACHSTQYAQLTASKTKHNAQSCAACHQDKHKMVPKCQDCHGDKHPASIMAKFPKCIECHKHPHDLNNWTAAAAAPKAAAPKPKKTM